jgi:hypothetical protein
MVFLDVDVARQFSREGILSKNISTHPTTTITIPDTTKILPKPGIDESFKLQVTSFKSQVRFDQL